MLSYVLFVANNVNMFFFCVILKYVWVKYEIYFLFIRKYTDKNYFFNKYIFTKNSTFNFQRI